MKILIIISDFSIGGAEHIIASLIRGLSSSTNQITLLIFNSIKTNSLLDSMAGRVFIVSLLKDKSSKFSFLLSFSRFILKKSGFDIIISNLQPVAYYLGLFHPLIKSPIIHILHNDYSPLKNPFKRYILFRFYKSPKVTPVSVSAQIKQNFLKKFGSDSIIINNGILRPETSKEIVRAESEVKNLKKDKDTLVFIGVQRLVWFKNLPNLAVAFKKIDDLGYNAILILLGSDPTKNQVEKVKIEKIGAPNVFMLEEKYNVADYLAQADCFCIVSSEFEGSSVAMLEALSYGLPVIGTYTGGIPTIIKDPDNGTLCEPTYESILNAIKRFIETPLSERIRIRETNQKLFSTTYDEKIMFENYRVLIEKVITDKR